ncbi:enoyl-CoA hydratase/isomerase family protein [Halorientalis sp.]|jgi:enoyl-CoA hydratase|uniref:enoyl-CoA hydratase/isomerase family protein n=1 Tax=Halorientalis sp. TaxID=1931229 RepID=UPI0026393655|nr:enoyl-CoA hydratase/isomerase family protein [Halorientalis sp.]
MQSIGAGTVAVSFEGHRADVLLDRPEKRNALNLAVIDDLRAAVETVDDRDDVRAMTLLGNGSVFSAGMDLELMAEADVDGHQAIYDGLRGLFDGIAALPIPTVVGVEQAAIAGAFELTLSFDFRILGADAAYGLKETKLGIFPFGGGTQRLPRLIGLAKAKELVMKSDQIDPEEAERLGLVNEVVEPGTVDEETRAYADELATRAPMGMTRAKECLHSAFDVTLDDGLDMEYDHSRELWGSDDRREGFAAMLEDRDPEFRGE